MFTAKLWRYPGDAAWYFIPVPVQDGAEIATLTQEFRRGFGSVRVVVKIAGIEWQTSIFPDKTSGSYILPVKATVRKIARIEDGDDVTVTMSIQT